IKTPQGRFPVAGAHVIVDHGANIGSRISGTRVAAGAVLLGPVGAILGGMAKKDRSKIYIVATLADGTVVSSDAPASYETVAREFAQAANRASKYWAEQCARCSAPHGLLTAGAASWHPVR